MSFGPGNAFGAFAPTVARPPRRVNSSGSFKDDSKQSSISGPAPIDHPITPSFGSWSGDANAAVPQSASTEQQRSFSSILSPSLPTPTARNNGLDQQQDPLAKPFVYTREFLLSLYDHDKATKRPIELAVNDIATKEQGSGVNKPWALSEWRDGEKELFSTSIHPPASRVRSQHGQARNSSTNVGDRDSNGHGGGGAFGSSPSLSHRDIPGGGINGRGGGESNTLDLASLGALPRERDRALASPSLSARSTGPLASPGLTTAEKERDLAAARRTRVGGTPLGGTSGILGGVLGGIGSARSPTLAKREAPGAGGVGGKDVWQGGRWRRQGSTQEDEEPKRPTAFGARRFPTNDDLSSPISSRPGTPLGRDSPAPSDGVRAAWDDDEDDSSAHASAQGQRSGIATPSNAEPQQQQQELQHQHQNDDLDLTHHASSVLGSLALDSDPMDDPLAPAPSTLTAPPGLPAPPQTPLIDQTWQYRDPSGQIQGPFAASMMHDWYRQTFFTPDLRVKRTSEREFETLENLIRRSGDAESPFLTAPLQPVATLPPPSTAAAGQQWPSASIDQFANNANGGSQRAFGAGGGSFYEPFGASTIDAQQQAQQQQQQQQFGFGAVPVQQSRQASSQGVDPWGAPLPAATPAWNDQPNAGLFNAGGGAYGQPQFAQPQQQPLDSPYQQHAQSPVDIFRQLAQQQQQQQQQQQPQPQQQQQYFDPSQLGGANDWRTTPQLQHAQQPQPQQQQQQQQWSSLLPSRLENLNLNVGSPAMSPIGPPATASAHQSPAISFASAQPQQQQQQPIASPWGAVAPVEVAPIAPAAPAEPEVKQEEKVNNLPPSIAAPKEFTSIAQTSATDKVVKEAQAAKLEKEKEVAAAAAASKKEEAPSTPSKSTKPGPSPSTAVDSPLVVPAPAPSSSPAPKPSSTAPWSAPVASSSPSSTPSGPSLREIQEAEAREADKRKAAARIQVAQANIQAAQRIAAQEAAEQLPATAMWGAGAEITAKAVPAPWSKPAAKPVGKTLKEIQEEEERRKKAMATASAQAAQAGPVQVQKGYASSVASAAKTVAGAPWTTVAVKPAAVATAAAPARPIIPGLNLPSATASRTLPSKPTPAPIVRATPAPVAVPAAVAAPPTVSSSSIIRSVAVNGRPASAGRSNGQQYDAENPPPPSEEFMKWCKDALKGLTVPMDEFIQMLLSFPLDASPDVLEIISDSVYANSSTLDGRRFANEYAARRKMDVAARYPQIAMSKTVNRVGGGKPTSMAEALKSQPVAKTPEWSVKVAGGKKKKAGK